MRACPGGSDAPVRIALAVQLRKDRGQSLEFEWDQRTGAPPLWRASVWSPPCLWFYFGTRPLEFTRADLCLARPSFRAQFSPRNSSERLICRTCAIWRAVFTVMLMRPRSSKLTCVR